MLILVLNEHFVTNLLKLSAIISSYCDLSFSKIIINISNFLHATLHSWISSNLFPLTTRNVPTTSNKWRTFLSNCSVLFMPMFSNNNDCPVQDWTLASFPSLVSYTQHLSIFLIQKILFCILFSTASCNILPYPGCSLLCMMFVLSNNVSLP